MTKKLKQTTNNSTKNTRRRGHSRYVSTGTEEANAKEDSNSSVTRPDSVGLFESAAIGCVHLNESGSMLQVNLTAAAMLGASRETLVLQQFSEFILPQGNPPLNDILQKVTVTGAPEVCDVRMVRKDNSSFWARMHTTMVQYGRTPVYQLLLTDISDWKFVQEERDITRDLLNTINVQSDFSKLMEELTSRLQTWSGCDSVGIRLKEGEDYPYFVTEGFPERLVQQERYLCDRNVSGSIDRNAAGNPVLSCMCGNVICGRVDPTKSFFTSHGSFWTNCTTDLLAKTTDQERQSRTRIRCNGEGYESVALIPLRTAGTTYGLLQCNDKRNGRFSVPRIEMLERVADTIAVAIAYRRGLADLTRSEQKYRLLLEQSGGAVGYFDIDGTILFLNDVALKDFGDRLDDFAGRNVTEIFGVVEGTERLRRIRAAAASFSSLKFEDHVALDHGKRWVQSEYSAIVDGNGKVISVQIVSQDITKDKEAGEALKMSQRLLAETERVGRVGGWEFNIDTGIQTWTEEIYRIHEVDRDHTPTVEKGIQFYSPSSKPVIERAVQRVIENNEPFDLELEIITARGNRRHVRAIGKPDLEHRRVYGFFQDITEQKQAHEQLQENERNLSAIAENAHDAILIALPSGFLVYANRRAAELTQYSIETLLTMNIRALAHPEELLTLTDRFQRRISGEFPPHLYETRIVNKSGLTVPVEVSAAQTEWREMPANLIILRDISQRKLAEERVRLSEERFSSLFSEMVSGCSIQEIICDEKGVPVDYVTLDVNKSYERMLNVRKEEVVGKCASEILPAEELRSWLNVFGDIAQGAPPQSYEQFSPLNNKYFAGMVFSPRRGQFAVTFEDVTERRQAKDNLLASLEEKEILLREVHHRVKNNLAAIIALLDMQQKQLRDPSLSSALTSLGNRIKSMALVHERLYRSQTLSRIDCSEYLRALVAHLQRSLDAPESVQCSVIAKDITVGLDVAVPVGMIVNELVTNALKHAFPAGPTPKRLEPPHISVSFERTGAVISLTVADNGMGIPDEVDLKTTPTLGLRLVTMLGEHQLGGTVVLDRFQGTRIVLTFNSKH